MVRSILVLLFLTGLFFQTSRGQADLVSITRADSLTKIQSKQMVVLLSAPWCAWCKKLKMQSLADKRIDSTLNEVYYFFELNVEDSTKIEFDSKIYAGATTNNNHELAIELSGKSHVTVPTLLIFNDKREVIFQQLGYLTPNELVAVLLALKQ